MTLKDIAVAWLKANGYDGLYNAGECGCENSDLMPCGEPSPIGCSPGYKIKCPGGDFSNCYGDCGFHIGATKDITPAPDDKDRK